MKQSKYSSGMIPTTDDLDFEARSKNYAIEQTRFDFLKQQTTVPNDKVKGVVPNSGLTASAESRPLRAYTSISVGPNSDTINIYSGIAYDGFEGRSNRIWVPDIPTNVPLNPAAAVANYSDIDMPDEVQTKDFTTATRPPRLVLGPDGTSRAFTVADDATNPWYVCIKFVWGEYDPITIPIDGSQEDSKVYESYEIRVSQNTAAQLYGIDLDPWLQLATLNWDGSTLLISSDDRVFASAVTTLEEELIVQHQNYYHDNGIISTDLSKLLCGIDNTSPYLVTFTDPAFTSTEGMNIDGQFVTLVTGTSVEFDPATDPASHYWIYIDTEGIPRKTTDSGLAAQYLTLCEVSWDPAIPIITGPGGEGVPRDYRQFGTISVGQLSQKILGNTYDILMDMTLERVSDELKSARDLLVGNGIYIWPGHSSGPYVGGAGSLGANYVGAIVSVNNLNTWDRLFLNGRECNSLYGDSNVTISGAAGNYLVYADAMNSRDYHGYYYLNTQSYSPPVSDDRYPICWVTFDGAVITVLVDLRVYHQIGYWHIQRNRNVSGSNTLPQLLVWMNGLITGLAAGAWSSRVWLTDDWGGGFGQGGTSAGNPLFAARPVLQVYVEVTGDDSWEAGPDVTDDFTFVLSASGLYFTIHNGTGDAQNYRWGCVGPSYTNGLSTIQGADNPTYDT